MRCLCSLWLHTKHPCFECQRAQPHCYVSFRGLTCCCMGIVFQPFTLQRSSFRGFTVTKEAQDLASGHIWSRQRLMHVSVKGCIVSLSRGPAGYGMQSMFKISTDIGHTKCGRTKHSQWPIHDKSCPTTNMCSFIIKFCVHARRILAQVKGLCSP